MVSGTDYYSPVYDQIRALTECLWSMLWAGKMCIGVGAAFLQAEAKLSRCGVGGGANDDS